MKKIWKWIAGTLGIIVALVAILALVVWIVSEPMPQGKQGEKAETLAKKMADATQKAAWDSVGAVCWDFGGRQQHLWDKKRHLARVRWANFEVLVNINPKTGIAFENGKRVSAKKNDRLVEKAWKYWVNDSFWLNAPAKIFDPGTTRSLVTLDDGTEALLVQYASGGVTPGDAYLWILDENFRPKAWKLWVKIVPLKGLLFTWEDWMRTSEGAMIAQTHDSKLFTLRLSDIKTADTAAELNAGQDPFAPLFE